MNKFKLSESLSEKLRETGYQPENLPLLFLVPFVQIAWAEGFVQPDERRAILKIAARLRVTPQHPHFTELIEWLDERPSDEFFAETIEILRETLDVLPLLQNHGLRQILQAGCLRVAQAAPDTGVFRRRSRITPEERDEIYRLADRLSFSLEPDSVETA